MDVFLIGGITLFLCIAIQTAVTLVLVRLLFALQGRKAKKSGLMIGAVLEAVAGVLLLAFILQVSIWALVYMWVGEFSDFGTAFYFSGVSYATLGYGDIVLTPKWRILGAIEAMNGLLMGGFAASVFFTASTKLLSRLWGK